MRKQINHYNSVNKLNLTGLLYVAWIDRLFVDCFGLFRMVLTIISYYDDEMMYIWSTQKY